MAERFRDENIKTPAAEVDAEGQPVHTEGLPLVTVASAEVAAIEIEIKVEEQAQIANKKAVVLAAQVALRDKYVDGVLAQHTKSLGQIRISRFAFVPFTIGTLAAVGALIYTILHLSGVV